WNLNGWETLEAISLANKTVVTICRHKVIFEGDERIREEGSAGKALTTPAGK
ncbi:MAG: hypothetical protein HY300_08800, partial [Verrucomicrobia bacterium]|nr:hypothetical protein [Verrucomicrobiota bacterium]